MIPTVRQHPKEPVPIFSLMRWGLIPYWAKDSSIGLKTINAMSETKVIASLCAVWNRRDAIRRATTAERSPVVSFSFIVAGEYYSGECVGPAILRRAGDARFYAGEHVNRQEVNRTIQDERTQAVANF